LTTCTRAGGCAGTNYPFLTQKERDVETGLDYFGARYYASVQGRFTSADEIWKDSQIDNPQSWNKYAYVRNNPLQYIAPKGEKAQVTIETNDKDKTGTIVIHASFAIYSTDGRTSAAELEQQAKIMKEKSKPHTAEPLREMVLPIQFLLRSKLTYITVRKVLLRQEKIMSQGSQIQTTC
jgi:RHS repeat-associated protein